MQTDNTHHVIPNAAGEGVVTRQHSDAPSRRSTFKHEEDHDSCPFTALRRSSWFLTLLQAQKPTSPLEITQILSSFSVKNDFMFYPPPSTYTFDVADDGSVAIRDGILADSAKAHRVGGPRFSVHGIVPVVSDSESLHSATFEILFVPLEFEVQAYHIQQAEIVVERRIKIGGPLFLGNFGCPIPCNIIRPQKRMSSHVALFFHCNGEDIGGSGNARLVTLANALHVTLIVPEYPGYGLFAGRPSEASIKGAMERVIQYLFAVDPCLTPSRVILIGHSIGTGVAMHVAAYIQKLFEKYQSHYADSCSCPEEVPTQNPTGSAAEPFAQTESDTDSNTAPPTTMRCRHNYLGGIVLLSPFASLDCVESMSSFKKYGVTAKVMQYRQLMMDTDRLVSAPLHWTDGCTDDEYAGAKDVSVDEWLPPLLFRFARCYSFNRFPTVGVASCLQNNYHFFNVTPLLLIHGVEDPVIGPFHSTMIASMLRECDDGRNARVFLSLLRGGGHNDLSCAHIIRRFYKDQILMPHVRRQEQLQRLQIERSHSRMTPPTDGAAQTNLLFSVDAGDGRVAPNLHFLAPGEKVTVEVEERKRPRSLLNLTFRDDEAALESPPLPQPFVNMSFTAREVGSRQHTEDSIGTNARSGRSDGANEDERQRVQNASLIINTSISQLQNHVQAPMELAPATATMVHMALQPNADHTDVGSIMVAAMRQYAVPTATAHQLYTHHRQNAVVRRSLFACWFMILCLYAIGVGTAHAVLASESQARRLVPTHDPSEFRRDNRVLAWYVIEAVFNCILALLYIMHFRYGLGRTCKYANNSLVFEYIYRGLGALVWLMAFGTGIIMSMVVALAPPHRGGVEWHRWDVYPHKQHVWVARVPRWTMLSFAIWHLVLMSFMVIKNH